MTGQQEESGYQFFPVTSCSRQRLWAPGHQDTRTPGHRRRTSWSHWGCSNQVLQAGWLTHSRICFPTVLKAGVQDQGTGRLCVWLDPASRLIAAASSRRPLGWKGTGAVGDLFIRTLIPLHEGFSLKTESPPKGLAS